MAKFKTIYLILGSLNYKNGELNDLATDRLDKCLELISQRNDKEYGIICTGAYGTNFNNTAIPHGKYLFNYLRNNGISEDHFIEIAMSRHTVHDATKSKEIIEKHQFEKITVITTDFHKERVELIFSLIYPKEWVFKVIPSHTELAEERREKLTNHEIKAIAQIKEKGLYFEEE